MSRPSSGNIFSAIKRERLPPFPYRSGMAEPEKGDDLYVMQIRGNKKTLKIGRSDCPQRRARELCKGNRYFIDVIAVFPGRGGEEARVHRCLSQYRARDSPSREWFDVSAEEAIARIGRILRWRQLRITPNGVV